MKYKILTILMFFGVCSALGQTKHIQQSIYFETAKYDLTKESKSTLDILVDSLKNFQSYTISIKGNTDAIGDSTFNKKLSEQRVKSTEDYFIAHGVMKSTFTTIALGEEKPIADNLTITGKQKNRRVDIAISFIRKVPNAPVDSSQFLPSIGELYKQIELKPQQFCINPIRDTVLRCEKGTLVYVKANSFKISKSCNSKCLTIKVKEDFLKSEMILDNLSTTSDGQLIETQGMVYTEANDCKGNKLNLIKGKDLVIFVPTDTIVPDAQIFQGNRTPHDDLMNWTVSNTSVLGNFTLAELNICSRWLGCGRGEYRCSRCRFFFCRFKRIDNVFRGMVSKSSHMDNVQFRKCQRQLRRERRFAKRNKSRQPLPQTTVILERPKLEPELLPKCEQLEELYKKYGVENLVALTEAINKPLMDSLGVKTIKELQDTMTKISVNNFELSYLNKSISYADFKYYVYNTSKLGWSNIDVFAKLPKDSMVDMKVNLKSAKNIDCKIIFKERGFVLPATKSEGKYEFDNLPKGERIWIVALKYDNGKPYLSMQETTIDSKLYEVNFRILTLEELKLELGKLD